MRNNTKITFMFWGAILCFIAAALPSAAEGSPLPTTCTPHYGENADSLISRGLELAGLPDTPLRHQSLKAQSWLESRDEPDVVNTSDINFLSGHPSVGMLQVTEPAWNTTPTGQIYPFSPCARDGAISAAVRAELFENGWFG